MNHFEDCEFDCKCGCSLGVDDMSPKLLEMIDEAREIAGVPFKINSAIRCWLHNEVSGGSPTSSHLEGLALDVECLDSRTRWKMFDALREVGFRRIVLYPTFIHCDIDQDKAQDVLVLKE